MIDADYDAQILMALHGRGGFTTSQIAAMCKPMLGDKRTHSAFIRGRLLGLQAAGKVRPMDQLKPVCWVRVLEGPA